MNTPAPPSILRYLRSLVARLFAHYRVAVVLFAGIPAAAAFSLHGYSWPAGSEITIHLQLNRPPVVLQDGSSSWNASAADALALWNEHLDTVSFVQGTGSGGPAGDDGANSVFFSTTIYSDPFPTGVLAVTLNFSDTASTFTETDVIFNNNLKWNSYRGPTQGLGAAATWDLHRVALHELGHVLGLDHPDEHGQNVTAIMNSTITDLDGITADDIAGVKALYGRPALTAYLGAEFSYQVVSNNNPSSYAAAGLPPGLTIDSVTGVISGVATISGTYSVAVSANGPGGSKTVTVQIIVIAPDPPSFPGKLLQTLGINVNRLAADPARPRVYATVPGSDSVTVIDTVSLSIIKTIPIGPDPGGLAISVDGSKLWVANTGSTTAAIGVIDLNSLTTLPSIPAPQPASDVEEGLNNRLYVTPATYTGGTGGIMQIDASTGVLQGRLGGFEVYHGGFVEIGPDRKTLYFGNQGLSPSTAERFDISTVNGTLIQGADFQGGDGHDLKLSHDGQMLVYPNGPGNGTPPYATYAIPSSNLRGVLGTFNLGAYPGPAAFSGDDLFLYHYVNYESKIDIFDTRTFLRTGTIAVGATGPFNARDIVVDNKGERIFVATSFSPAGDVRIFDTGRKNTSTQPPVRPKSLLNVSTRLRVQTQDDALIGGFIIQGSDAKKVVLRAIGPSIPVNGRLTDPILTLYNSAGGVVASNDNWNAIRQAVLDTQLAPANEREPVIVASLPAGAYTMVVRGANDTTGIGLVELYDIDSTHSRVANISTRGKVESGDNVMIGGFIIGSDQPTKVIVRAIGPSLGVHGVTGALQDPILKLHDGNGSLISENDGWRSLQEQAITSTGLAPNDDRESAIVATLQPGNYTAVVSGKDGMNGVGLVEVYNLDAN